MKIVCVYLGGTLAPEDWLLVHAMSPRGGRTTAGAQVLPDRAVMSDGEPQRVSDSFEDIAKRIVLSAKTGFLPDAFTVLAKGHVIRFECQDTVDDVLFAVEVKGVGTETMTVSEY